MDARDRIGLAQLRWQHKTRAPFAVAGTVYRSIHGEDDGLHAGLGGVLNELQGARLRSLPIGLRPERAARGFAPYQVDQLAPGAAGLAADGAGRPLHSSRQHGAYLGLGVKKMVRSHRGDANRVGPAPPQQFNLRVPRRQGSEHARQQVPSLPSAAVVGQGELVRGAASQIGPGLGGQQLAGPRGIVVQVDER